MYPFQEGQIISFLNSLDGLTYDGVLWRVMSEDETNFSIFVRFVDTVD